MTDEQEPLVVDGYTRLSQDSDRSIPRQKEKIQEYINELNDRDDHPPVVLNTIFDDGRWSSGFSTANRGEYGQVLERIKNSEADLVVADGKRRFARDFDDTMDLILSCRSTGVELHDTSTGTLDLDDSMNVAIELLQAATEHKAMRRYIEKSIEETNRRTDAGYYHGQPPVALRFDENKQFLVADENRIDDVLRVYELRDAGESYRSIAEEVPWSPPTIGKLIDRRDQYEAVVEGAKLGFKFTIVEPELT
ncbi:resolvase domain protein [Natrialba magadii ATCC 43099]|uniref:Resolvase n=1 Tax=Natrialba magadii (strain ATCC 43099 / DSM 3394 / CCM 3739 / CIP 104546 / IAM 13178 / JCM 8861 / NBRC 102185 / NCIMB 2190 / MS3) TaxID=547559 RepID=D3SXD4_NATMM|nr:recombinase family protein [Natrialba magadii]ADD03954.1 resolvase domain protein [Natrialba magadii ATCC 43099]ELY33617.1 resolvase [Natrialba magadii ATCC 43099]